MTTVTNTDIISMFDEDEGWVEFALIVTEEFFNNVKEWAQNIGALDDFRVDTANGSFPLAGAVWK